jgi:hypothetical protein
LYELLVGCRPFDDRMQPGDWSASLQRMIEDRRRGISEAARQKLKPWSNIVGATIIRSLAGNREDRFPDGAALQRNLEWARNPQADPLFRPRTHPLSRFIRWTPFWTVSLLTMGISAAAVLFISTYNLDIAVPLGARGTVSRPGLFQQIMLYTNIVWFSLGGAIIFWLTRPVSRCLSTLSRGDPLPAAEIERAADRNLKLGHYVSLMSIIEWTLGGILYPVAFLLFGYRMTLAMSLEFIGSHFVAALITGAYVFWTVTFCALHVWQPRLLEAALDSDARLDWSGHHRWLQKLCGFNHVLAIAVPIVAIAWIVLVSDHDTDERSLSVLSLVALGGLVLLVWISRRVNYWLGVLRSFDPVEEDF